MRKKRPSPALTLIQHVWDHQQEAIGPSWTRLNQSMSGAVRLAISAGLRFGLEDFKTIAEPMRIGYWCGADYGERWYTDAIVRGHLSAARAYETWRGRKPFLLQTNPRQPARQRLHVGSDFMWQECRVQVTSFAADQSYLTAVQRATRCKPEPCPKCGREEWTYSRRKIARRFRITHEDIRGYHAKLKDRSTT